MYLEDESHTYIQFSIKKFKRLLGLLADDKGDDKAPFSFFCKPQNLYIFSIAFGNLHVQKVTKKILELQSLVL